jgi:hypothetical protein
MILAFNQVHKLRLRIKIADLIISISFRLSRMIGIVRKNLNNRVKLLSQTTSAPGVKGSA